MRHYTRSLACFKALKVNNTQLFTISIGLDSTIEISARIAVIVETAQKNTTPEQHPGAVFFKIQYSLAATAAT
jgi:hypothetical protein